MYLMGVYLTGVHLLGVHLIGVHLIDVYFMDVYMFPNQKRVWGKPPDPPTLQTVVDLFELRAASRSVLQPWQAIPSSTEVMILS
jgi:hypothetical protein